VIFRVCCESLPNCCCIARDPRRRDDRNQPPSALAHALQGASPAAATSRVEAINQQHADALIVGAEGENYVNRRLVGELAEKARLPAIYPDRDFVEAGGLMAYAIDLGEYYYRAAGYIDQILKGTNAGEIPVYQMTKLELVINVKAAEAIG